MVDLTPFTCADNTFTGKEKSFAAVEVGDSKQKDKFYPQAKIMRWGNEVNFSVRLVTDALPVAVGNPADVVAIQAVPAQRVTSQSKVAVKPGGSFIQPIKPEPVATTSAVALVDNKVVWATPAVEAIFYQVGDGKEGDGFEFEIILNEPPASNVVSMTIETKGLDFFYQPPLTPEEIKQGCIRPDNVAGSYAVYHKTMAGDYSALGGKNYMAGKVFHIMRPRIEDAKGNWIWGELNIDEKAGLLTVTIPQDFLDKAVYPVIVDPTIGYTSIGATFAGFSANWVLATAKTQADASGGTLSNIKACVANAVTTGYIKMAVYNDLSGVPDTVVANSYVGITSITRTTKPTQDSEWTSSSSLSGTIVANSYYWVAFSIEAVADNNTKIAYDTGFPNGTTKGNTDSYSSFPKSTFPTLTNRAVNCSIYATYAPAGGSTYEGAVGLPLLSAMAEAVNLGISPAALGFAAGSAIGEGNAGIFPKTLAFPAASTLGLTSQEIMRMAVALSGSAGLSPAAIEVLLSALTLSGITSLGLSAVQTMLLAQNLAALSAILTAGGGMATGGVTLSGATAFNLQMSKSLVGTMALNVAALMTPAAQSSLTAVEVLSAKGTFAAGVPILITLGGLNLAVVTALQEGAGNLFVATLSMAAQTALGFNAGKNLLVQLLLGANASIISSLSGLVVLQSGFKILVVCTAPELLSIALDAQELNVEVEDG